MTSNRTKAVLIAALVLVGAGIALVVYGPFSRSRNNLAPPKTQAVQQARDLQGAWEGALQVQNARLRLVLNVTKSADGNYHATLDSIDQGAKGIPVNTLDFSDGTLRLQLNSLGAAFEGQLAPNGNDLEGEWQQAGKYFPLIFQRTATPSTMAAPLSAAAYARRSDVPLQGWWQGTLRVRDVSFRLLFKIAATPPKGYQGTLDSVDQGGRNIQITSIDLTDATVRMGIGSLDGHFEGTLSQDKETIDGTWTQAGMNLPLTLGRIEAKEEQALPESAYAFISEAELQGIWQGTLDVSGAKLRLVIKIAKKADGTYQGAMDSLDQGAVNIPATLVTFKDNNVEVEWKALRALYHGQLEAGKLIGFWQQGAVDTQLDMVRTNRASNVSAPKN